MIRPPRSLYGQLMLALGVGMLIALSLVVWFMLEDQAQEHERLTGIHLAQRIANVVQILNHASPDGRRDLVQALNVSSFRRIDLSEPWQAEMTPSSEPAQTFSRALREELGDAFPVHILSFGKPAMTHAATATVEARYASSARGARSIFRQVILQTVLHDGTVVTLQLAIPSPHGKSSQRMVGLLILMGMTMAMLMAWVVRRLTRPLSALSVSATSLPRNLDQPPVAESGPAEVAAVARAFNTMQRELKKMLETRTQALAGVSHDLRLPITRLRLRLERLDDAALRDGIGSDLDEMSRMIANTLEFLRAGQSTEAPVPLNMLALIETVAEEMEGLGAIIRIHGPVPAPVWVRPLAMRRCLNNLVDNARRYGGGELDIGIEQNEQWLEIRIEDRGPGIPVESMEHVFEPYVRLETSRDKNTGGSGLGLAIARSVARHEGGDIRLEDRPGGGLSVILSLPRDPVPKPVIPDPALPSA